MLIVGNTGHFENEIELAGSEGLQGMHVDTIKPQKIVSFSPLMSRSITNQVLVQLYLFRCWRHCTFLHSGRHSPSVLKNMRFIMVSRSTSVRRSGTAVSSVCFVTAARGPAWICSEPPVNIATADGVYRGVCSASCGGGC